MRFNDSTTTRIVIGGAFALFAFGSTVSAQLPPVKPGPTPNEANFFIATPPGWVQPKTPWGDPDFQGIWPISYVGTVMLQRCAGGFGPRAANAPPCDPHKAFLTATEFDASSKGRRSSLIASRRISRMAKLPGYSAMASWTPSPLSVRRR